MKTKLDSFRAVQSGWFFALVALVGLGLLSTASGAKAGGCAVPSKTGTASSIPFVPLSGAVRNDDDKPSGPHAIVGLWHVNYTAETETGAPIFPPVPFAFLESFKTWHGDGTEFEQALKPPTGGNFCYGVWKDLGHGAVKLHHIGVMFDSMGNVSNLFTEDEKNTVAANGKSYKGTFVFKLWGATFDTVGFETPIAEVTGTMSAPRIA